MNLVQKKEHLHKQIGFCKQTRQLYDKVNRTASPITGQKTAWKIELSDSIPFDGSCDYANRVIRIKNNLPEKQALATVVFELANAANSSKFYEIHKKAVKGWIGCEEYAKCCEAIEFEGVLLHKQIMGSTLAKMRWGDEVNIYRDSDQFNDYWEQVHAGPHTQFWRDSWKRVYASKPESILKHYLTSSPAVLVASLAATVFLSFVANSPY